MFRKMRRAERELPEGQAKEILENGSYGVLALAGDGGYPYAVPLNYVYDGERIYFHCAAEGHKIDAIAWDNKCSFCVVENGGVIEDRFTTKYRSVIAFGKIYEETDEKCRENAFRLMMRSLTPSVTNEKREEMSHCQKARILAMDNKCSFCVVENGGVIEDRFTTKYRSVIAFGKIYEETDEKCRENAFRLMMRSLTPSVTNEKREEMSHCQKARILAMDIEYLSGKGANQ